LHITFDSIFNTYHSALIFRGTITDLGILLLFLGCFELHLRQPWQVIKHVTMLI